jgi:predicted transcriptional regulator
MTDTTFRLTCKQGQILTALLKGNADGDFLDIDQLVEAVPYDTTKQSMQFSLRALIKHNLVEKREREKRRGRLRNILAPTSAAVKIMSF